MIAAAIGRLGRVEEGRRFRPVAKSTILDFEEADAGERVEEPRQTIGSTSSAAPRLSAVTALPPSRVKMPRSSPARSARAGGTAAISCRSDQNPPCDIPFRDPGPTLKQPRDGHERRCCQSCG
jgi:hypothetical protein